MSHQLIELSQMLSAAAHSAGERSAAVLGPRKSACSALILDRQRIVTTDAGIQDGEDLQVLTRTGIVAAASLLGRDPGKDLALLSLAEPIPFDLPPLAFAPDPQVGEILLTVSHHPQTGLHAAMGVLSSSAGPWQTARRGRLPAFWKLDSAPYPGLSGSAVVRADGALLGMASANLARGTGVIIPGATIHHFVQTILEQGHIRRGYLGVGLQPLPQLGGMIVLEVAPQSPSAAAGLFVGDVILRVAGEPIPDFSSLEDFLEDNHIGQALPFDLYRAGQHVQVQVRVGARPVAA